MQKREKGLLACVVVLLGIVGLWYVYGWIEAKFETREQRIASLQSEISGKQLEVAIGRKAARRLAEYEARSLPANRELARSLYQNWLTGLVDKTGLACDVASLAPQTRRGEFTRLNFTVSGEGTLSQVISLLHAFYASGHLHQVRMLTLKPLKGGDRFGLLFAVEAFALDRAKAVDRLPHEPPAVPLRDLAAYQKTIVGRNMFAPYTPPAAPAVAQKTRSAPAPAPPPFDVARHTTVSAILSQDGRPQVWLNNRTTGEILRLGVGNQFQVGDLRGTVQRIGLHDVEVLSDGQRWVLALGANLREGAPIAEKQSQVAPTR